MKDFDQEIFEVNIVTAHLLHVVQRMDVILEEIEDFSKGKNKQERHLYTMAAGCESAWNNDPPPAVIGIEN